MPDDPSVADAFSPGADRFLNEICPHGRPRTTFPRTLARGDTRRGAAETLHQWFVRLIDQHSPDDVSPIALEDGIGIFANFAWQRDVLTYASMPTLIVPGSTLEAFYCDAAIPVVYLRLDVDDTTLGTPFSHPLAHVHVADDAYPRFALDGGASGNVIVDYLEFLYRQYVPQRWLDWARRQWQSSGRIDPDHPEDDPFERIVQAFNDGRFDILKKNAHTIGLIKSQLRQAKDSLFTHGLHGPDRLILEYPKAR